MTTTSALTPSQPEAPWSVVFDTKGGAQPAPLETADGAAAIGPLTWVHLHPGDSDHFLLSQVGKLPSKVMEYFAQPAGQARLVAVADGLLMTLRGLEQPPGGLPAELPSIQVWLGRNRVVTSASPVPAAIREIYSDLMAGAGPKGPADFLGRLALLLFRDLGPLLDDNSGALDLLETRILTREVDHLGRELNTIRLNLLRLHRHLSPQRTLLHELLLEYGRHRLGPEETLSTLREASGWVDDRLERLKGQREHCGALQEALADLQSQRMNNALYLLSLYTALFLPMGVLTGLLGINLAGIPGEKSPWGFWIVCLLLVLFGAAGYWVFKKLGLTQPIAHKGRKRHRLGANNSAGKGHPDHNAVEDT
jgi:zinc transporter